MSILAKTFIVLLVVAIIIMPELYINNPIIISFFNSNINLILVLVVVILVATLNKIAGVLLLLLVAIMIVNTRNHSDSSPFTNTMHILPVKETFVRARVPVYPGVQPTGGANQNYNIQDQPLNMTLEHFKEHIGNLQTQDSLKSADGGADIVAYESEHNHNSHNGGPLADCNSYDLKIAHIAGTVFYPLTY